MPTVKQSIGIAIAIAMVFAAATAFGIGAVEHTAHAGLRQPRHGFKG